MTAKDADYVGNHLNDRKDAGNLADKNMIHRGIITQPVCRTPSILR